ncbi:MAG TPA: ATP-binding protein [Polyangia bacterium]|nr:ATP-binding protein [Polyangia bacterium]
MPPRRSSPPNNQLSLLEIAAEPTKEFFISMLSKDIGLIPAIIDLIDNSLDGALRLKEERSFDGLHVNVDFSPSKFSISDNCGGIPVDIARNYAFCFGRPDGMPPTEHSMGQFGVGMKRALFKLGNLFTIDSTTATSHFQVKQNVAEWKRTKDWKFRFATLEENKTYSAGKRGTTIVVEQLHEGIKADFALDNFSTRLTEDIAARHAESMSRGLEIKVNGVALQSHKPTALKVTNIKHAHRTEKYKNKSHAPVDVDVFAGVDESEPKAAGWYVFCNDRLILRADQTLKTGWGENNGKTIPKYHNQYARFRGYVRFDSKEADQLPWNTTKTSIDEDHPVWRAVRLQMIEAMRPVIDFLNEVKEEKDNEEDESTPLNDMLDAAESAPVDEVSTAKVFGATVKKRGAKKNGIINILYKKPIDQVDLVKEALGVESAKEVGEKTFEYFFKYECSEEK